MTKFLLDSGDPNEYIEIANLAKNSGSQLWGSTTNPSLIAKKLAGKKISQDEAFRLQKEIVLEILNIVPGAVSAEVYADEETTAQEMIDQGMQIASWNQRIFVKLPTSIEGFKARTALRREKIQVNNTLVFSEQQVFAICLHEKIMQKLYCPIQNLWPCFISPFVGRLDDINEDGMSFIENSMKMKKQYFENTPTDAPWMLEASIRRAEHIKRGILANVEIMTVPGKVYKEWLLLTKEQQEALNPTAYAQNLAKIAPWEPPEELLAIASIDEFIDALQTGALDIKHDLTDKGIIRFAQDWKAIISS